MVLATASLVNPDYNVENYQIFLLTTIFMLIHGCISSMPTLYIARFNSVGTSMNIIILIVVVILIPAATTNVPKFTDSATVWGTITNGTGWPDGIAILMSFVSVIWTMSGYDAPFHLAEECSNANIASPRAIVLTSGVGGIMGWALQLVIAYTVTDIASVLDADQPWAGYCYQVLSEKAALAVISLTICCAFMMGQGCMVAACTSLQTKVKLIESSCYIRVCPRWMFPALPLLETGPPDYSNPRKCGVVQRCCRRGSAAAYFCRQRCDWCSLFRRRNCGLRCVHHSHCNPCVFCRQSVPPRSLESRPLQQTYWLCRLCVCCSYVASSLFPCVSIILYSWLMEGDLTQPLWT